MVKSSQLGKIDKHAGWNTSEKSKQACPSSNCSKRQLRVHCKFLPHENYRDWELQGPCRENLYYLWKRAVRITKKPYVSMLWANPVIFTDYGETQ